MREHFWDHGLAVFGPLCVTSSERNDLLSSSALGIVSAAGYESWYVEVSV